MNEEDQALMCFQIHKNIPTGLIKEYLHKTLDKVHSLDPKESALFKQLPIFLEFESGTHSNAIQYSDGPLGLLFLFGLRRFLNGKPRVNPSDGYMHISDNDSELLPNDFRDIEDHLYCVLADFLEKKGCVDLGRTKTQISTYAHENGYGNYIPGKGIQPLAIAMGCIEAPLNLSLIRTDKSAAFF